MTNSCMCELVSSLLKHVLHIYIYIFRGINFPAHPIKMSVFVGEHAGLSAWESQWKLESHGNIFITCPQSFLFGDA